MLHNLLSKITSFLDRLAPEQPHVPLRKALSISFGVGFTLLVIVLLNHAYGALKPMESMVLAVFGVSAVLIFLFPSSKFYAPFTILESNLLAGCIALAGVYLFSMLALEITFAILGTILGLYFLNCIHPPALFIAIVIVMAGVDRLEFVFYPVLVDSLVLSLASYLYRQYLKN